MGVAITESAHCVRCLLNPSATRFNIAVPQVDCAHCFCSGFAQFLSHRDRAVTLDEWLGHNTQICKKTTPLRYVTVTIGTDVAERNPNNASTHQFRGGHIL